MSSPSSPELEGSTLVSSSPCPKRERSAVSSGTPTAGGYWLPEWLTAALTPAPSGTTLPHSTGNPGVDAWISSAAAFPARTCLLPAAGKESSAATAAVSGMSSPGSLARWDRDTSSWKTSQLSLTEGWTLFSDRWPTWGMMRSGGLYRLPTWERPTSGSDCSYWPTVAVGDNHNRRGASSTAVDGLATAAVRWPTPNASVANDGERPETWRARAELLKEKHGNGNGAGTPLSIAAQEFWPTPNVPNGGRSMSAEDVAAKGKTAKGKRQVQLENVAKFHSEEVCSHPAPETETAGESSSPPTRRLNPLFVEMLQGFPIGWTGCAPLAMR